MIIKNIVPVILIIAICCILIGLYKIDKEHPPVESFPSQTMTSEYCKYFGQEDYIFCTKEIDTTKQEIDTTKQESKNTHLKYLLQF